MATNTSSAAPAVTVSPFKFIEPVNKINGVGANSLATIEFPPRKRINTIHVEATVIKAAGGAGVTSIPLVLDIIGQMQFKIGGKPQRTRLASDLFGATGLNALCDVNAGGTVVYVQAGNATLSTKPVLIGSAADVAQQALLTANLATTATFELPILFAEPYRKEYSKTEALALVTGFSDGSGLGLVTLELAIPDNAATFSGHNIKAFYEYDDLVAPAGSRVLLVKEYRHGVQYSAAGDIEVASQLYLRDGLMRVSLLTTADYISRVIVKQGQRVLRDLTHVRSQAILTLRDYNPAGMVNNRFDIEFDLNDDPNSTPVMDPNLPLSIVATLDTAADATKNIAVLSSYYGPVD
jgi:hypothetical protein